MTPVSAPLLATGSLTASHGTDRERLASAAGTTQFLTFSGAMSGPFLVGQWVSAGGSYAQGMLWMAVCPILVGLMLLRRAARQHPPS